jgi:hypothetical protein
MSTQKCIGVPSYEQVIQNIYKEQEKITSNGLSQYQTALMEYYSKGKKQVIGCGLFFRHFV